MNKYERRWMRKYNLLCQYKKKHCTLKLPKNYKVEGEDLYCWVVKQRLDYKNGKLSLKRKELLENIGFQFEGAISASKTSFNEQIIIFYLNETFSEVYSQYKLGKNFIDAFIPEVQIGIEYDGYHHKDRKEEDEKKNDGYEKSGEIKRLIRIREPGLPELDVKNLKNQDFLHVYKMKELTPIGFLQCLKEVFEKEFSIIREFDINEDLSKVQDAYNDFMTEDWNKHIELCLAYIKIHGNLLVPQNYVVEGVNLGYWIGTVRAAYKGRGNGTVLGKEKITQLNEIGMVWDVSEYDWEIRFEEAYKRYLKEGNIDFKKGEYSNGLNMGGWIANMRSRYKKGTLSKDKIERLERIGIKWSYLEASFDLKCKKFLEFKEKHGNLNIPVGYITEDGIKLYDFLANCRAYYKRRNTKNRNSKFTEERIQRLLDIGVRLEDI